MCSDAGERSHTPYAKMNSDHDRLKEARALYRIQDFEARFKNKYVEITGDSHAPPVFSVSNKDYQTYRDDESNDTVLSLEGSGVPELRRAFYRLTSEVRFKTIENYQTNTLWHHLSKVRMASDPEGFGGTDSIRAIIQTCREKVASTISVLATDLTVLVEDRFGALNKQHDAWYSQAAKVCQKWSKLNAMKYRSMFDPKDSCRNARFATQKELLIVIKEGVKHAMSELMKESKQQYAFAVTRIRKHFDSMKRKLEENQMTNTEFLKRVDKRMDMLINELKRNADEAHKEIKRFIDRAVYASAASFLNKDLEPLYEALKEESGKAVVALKVNIMESQSSIGLGSHARRVAKVNGHLLSRHHGLAAVQRELKEEVDGSTTMQKLSCRADVKEAFEDIYDDLDRVSKGKDITSRRNS